MGKYKKDWEGSLKYALDKFNAVGYAISPSDWKKYDIELETKGINLYLRNETNYKDYRDYFRKHGLKFQNDLDINGIFKNTEELVLEDYVELVKNFYNKKGKYPSQKEFCLKNNLPSGSAFYRMLKNNDITQTYFNKLVGNPSINPNDYSYEYWLDLYIQKSREIGEPLKQSEVSKYGLPSSRWFLENCSNPNVVDYNSFIEYEIGMKPRFNMSKEKITELILQLQNKTDRPIQKKDLNKIDICPSTVYKIWGSFNEMKESLGLDIIYKSRKANVIDLNAVKRCIVRICSYVYENEGRTIITQGDWKNIDDYISYSACSTWLKNNNSSIREFIESIGFQYIQTGSGLNHTFDDGEKVKSQYELYFSKYLRNNLYLTYEKDYFREIRYKTFIDDYEGLMDCDYIIHINNKTIYIEIAGMLGNYKDTYKNKPIKSKTKEKYRQNLIEKEEMLKVNNLEYYILFPSDIKDTKLNNLFDNIIKVNK